jgi:hypothetical protein
MGVGYATYRCGTYRKEGRKEGRKGNEYGLIGVPNHGKVIFFFFGEMRCGGGVLTAKGESQWAWMQRKVSEEERDWREVGGFTFFSY